MTARRWRWIERQQRYVLGDPSLPTAIARKMIRMGKTYWLAAVARTPTQARIELPPHDLAKEAMLAAEEYLSEDAR